MWVFRVGLAFPLILLMGQQIPQIVHNFTPFEAKHVETMNVSCGFAKSKMIDFFEYQITYDLKAFVREPYYNKLFGIADEVNDKLQIYINYERKIDHHSFFTSTHNTTIATISVPPLLIKGIFFKDSGPRNLTFLDDSFGMIIPGAEPLFNPLVAAVAVVYFLSVVCGFIMEVSAQRNRNTPYRRMENEQEEVEITPVNRRKHGLIFVYWMIVVAVIESVLIIVAMKYGVVPSFFHLK